MEEEFIRSKFFEDKRIIFLDLVIGIFYILENGIRII